ncbi:MAG: tetratricopeptide repeat protein, partial [Desulfovibrionaceae bacterium]
KALGSLKRALKYDKGFLQAMATLGSAYITRGEYDEAQPLLEQAVTKEPMFGPAWNNLALVHMEKKEWPRAKECLEKAAESGYDVPAALLDEVNANL